MTRHLVSDLKYVAEDYRTEDLLGFDTYLSKLKAKVEASAQKSLIGIVGNYGSGKSVMLEALKEQLGDSVHWIHFDAWKYPDRNHLWEGFVLDFVQQLSPDDFKQVLKEIDGSSEDAKKALISLFGDAAGFLNFVVPGTGLIAKGAIDKLSYFANTSPARRVFQIQDIFQKLLKKRVKKPVYIVIEDADRSGEAGIFFIETLSQFLKSLDGNDDIKVFIPIAQKSFIDKRDAYIKALDLIDFYDLGSRDLTRFVEKIFNNKLAENPLVKHHIVEWLQRLVHNHQLTIRDLKSIIRNTNSQFVALQNSKYSPDARICLMIESSRYIFEESLGKADYIFSGLVTRKKVDPRTPLELFLFAIGRQMYIPHMADIVNHNTVDTAFSKPIEFIGNEEYSMTKPQSDYGIPYGMEGRFVLPQYYILD